MPTAARIRLKRHAIMQKCNCTVIDLTLQPLWRRPPAKNILKLLLMCPFA
jgi:hypothetical protein